MVLSESSNLKQQRAVVALSGTNEKVPPTSTRSSPSLERLTLFDHFGKLQRLRRSGEHYELNWTELSWAEQNWVTWLWWFIRRPIFTLLLLPPRITCKQINRFGYTFRTWPRLLFISLSIAMGPSPSPRRFLEVPRRATVMGKTSRNKRRFVCHRQATTA